MLRVTKHVRTNTNTYTTMSCPNISHTDQQRPGSSVGALGLAYYGMSNGRCLGLPKIDPVMFANDKDWGPNAYTDNPCPSNFGASNFRDDDGHQWQTSNGATCKRTAVPKLVQLKNVFDIRKLANEKGNASEPHDGCSRRMPFSECGDAAWCGPCAIGRCRLLQLRSKASSALNDMTWRYCLLVLLHSADQRGMGTCISTCSLYEVQSCCE